MQAAIYGMAGTELTGDERAFFRDADAAGYIIFRRNCEDQAQLLRLTDELRSIAGRPDVPILIDQRRPPTSSRGSTRPHRPLRSRRRARTPARSR
jgi:beta-glucosidase-like glycosyl hydrolase